MPIRPELRHFYRTPEWFAARQACKQGAGDRCQQCGLKNGDVYERGLRTIKVQCGCAHWNNQAGDDRPENLGWLCRRCHLHHDKLFHKLTRANRKDLARPLIAAAQG